MPEVKYEDLFAGNVNARLKETIGLINQLDRAMTDLVNMSKQRSVTTPLDATLQELKTLNQLAPDAAQKIAQLEARIHGLEKANTLVAQSFKDVQSFTTLQTESTARLAQANSKLVLELKKVEREYGLSSAQYARVSNQIRSNEKLINAQQTALNRNTKAVQANAGSYTSYQQKLTRVNKLIKNFKNGIDTQTDSFDRTIPSLNRLITLQGKYDRALKQSDRAIGVSTRHVGNYGRAFNGLNNSVNQLSRESPAFFVSFQTGLLALSNNIPIFVDQVDSIRVANKQLVSEGKPVKSLFSQLSKAIFSWQTALSLGITLLVFFGKELQNLAKELFATKKAFDAVKEVNDGSTEAVIKATTRFQALYNVIKGGRATNQQILQAIRALNKEFPAFNIGLEKTATGYEVASDKASDFVLALSNQAKAATALEKLEEKRLELFELEKKEALDRKEIAKNRKIAADLLARGQTDASIRSTRLANGQQIRLDKEILKYKELAEAIKDLQVLFASLFNGTDEGKIPPLPNIDFDFGIDALIKDVDAKLAALILGVPNIELDFEVPEEEFASFEDRWQEFLLVREFFSQTSADRLLEIEKENLANILASTILGEEAKFKAAKASQDKIDKLSKAKKKRDDEAEKEKINRTIDNIAIGAEQLQLGINTLFEIGANNRDRAFEDEIARSNASLQAQLEAAGDNAAERAIIEERFAEQQAEIRTRQAKADKQAALTKIAIDTAVAVAQALLQAAVYSSNPLTAALAAGAYAAAATAGAAGIAQAAIVGAQKIPEFADGTKAPLSHDTMAIVGEKGSELINSPKTGASLSPNKPTLVHLSKGSTVTTAAETSALFNTGLQDKQYMEESVRVINIMKTDSITPMQMQFAVSSAIKEGISNQTNIINEVNERGFNTYRKKGENRTKYYNKRYA